MRPLEPEATGLPGAVFSQDEKACPIVLMGANNPKFSNKEAAKLLDKGFAMVNGKKS